MPKISFHSLVLRDDTWFVSRLLDITASVNKAFLLFSEADRAKIDIIEVYPDGAALQIGVRFARDERYWGPRDPDPVHIEDKLFDYYLEIGKKEVISLDRLDERVALNLQVGMRKFVQDNEMAKAHYARMHTH